jgi:hypothetical protein
MVLQARSDPFLTSYKYRMTDTDRSAWMDRFYCTTSPPTSPPTSPLLVFRDRGMGDRRCDKLNSLPAKVRRCHQKIEILLRRWMREAEAATKEAAAARAFFACCSCTNKLSCCSILGKESLPGRIRFTSIRMFLGEICARVWRSVGPTLSPTITGCW